MNGLGSKCPVSMVLATHVLAMFDMLGCMNGRSICGLGSGCNAMIVRARSVRGPHSLE